MKKIILSFSLLAGTVFSQSFVAALAPQPAPPPAPTTIPSGIIPSSCKTVPSTSLLSCYLNHPSNNLIQNFIQGPYSPSLGSWKNWPAWAKNDLNIAYLNTVAWYNSGMQNYPGTLVQDPPPSTNEAAYAAGIESRSMLDPNTTAWQIYIGHTALTLAAEIHGWVPWSIHNFNSLGLSNLLDHGFGATNLPGVFPIQSATPGNAITVFKFMKQNNLIGATRSETIDRFLTWCRWNLSHMYGDYTVAQYYRYWQYWGKPPVSRILAGTFSQDPAIPTEYQNLQHWTQGCYGTTALMIWVFKTINIPVKQASVGYHLAPYFISEGMYLTHGDDPYNGYSRTLPRPIRDLLINETTYQAWFPSNDVVAADKNVGRRVVELNMKYPSDDLAKTHAFDKMMGRTRANGSVFETMGRFYTMAQLDASGFWTRLESVIPVGQ
ncbi:MAG: hypothetical protein NTV52_11585 [Acidobacteria bacterium]|nr:hypothetical protein [Acidobacteriota bacterium]